VNVSIDSGEILGVVGESGCGKSVTSLSIMNLVPHPGKIKSGSIRFKGEELVGASDKRMRQIRGNEIAMIFQEPMTSLNQVFIIGDQKMVAIRLHKNIPKAEAAESSTDMLKKVGVPRDNELWQEYPPQLP